MDRRNFLCTAILATAPWLSSPARAEVATAATVAATAQLASAVIAYLGRGSDPTIPILISLTEMVEALGKKINVIDYKLDMLMRDLAEIRQLVKLVPSETVSMVFLHELREPWDAFLEESKLGSGIADPKKYYAKIAAILERLQTARRKYASITSDNNFDGAIHMALAHDNEVVIASELMRPEAIDAGFGIEPKHVYALLNAYQSYFARAMDPDLPGSLAFLSEKARKAVVEALSITVETQPARKVSAGLREPAKTSSFRDILLGGKRGAQCGFKGDLCIVPGPRGKCAEPGHRDYYDVTFLYARETIVDPQADLEDKLLFPYLHEIKTDFKCENGSDAKEHVAPVFADESDRVNNLNSWVTRYYRLAYVLAVCRKVVEINGLHRAAYEELVSPMPSKT